MRIGGFALFAALLVYLLLSERFETRAEAEQFIAEVAAEPNPEDAVLAKALSVVEVEFETVPN
jgi:hypothetical protein